MKKISVLFILAIALCTSNSFAGGNEDLFNACKKGDLEGVKKAIGAGAEVNGLDAAGNTAISSAFFWPDIVKYLLENKADPNLGNTTVLYQACFYASADVIKLVLDAGADPNKACVSDAASGLKNLITEEKKKGRDANKSNIKVWEMAVKMLPSEVYALPYLVSHTNCVSCLKMMLDKGANVEKGVAEGTTMLHTFASDGASKEYRKTVFGTIKTSIEPYGFKVPDWYINPTDANNGTPDEMLKLLLTKGLKINQKNKGANGIPPQTPLGVALNSGLGNKEEVTLALVNNGADVKEEDAYGDVILLAAQCGFSTVLKAMVEKGADINTEGKCYTDASNSATIKNFTPLTCAAAKNRLDAVKFLIEKGAKTDGISGLYAGNACAPNLKNKSAIYFAIENKNMEMVKFLAEHNGFNKKNLSVTAKKMSNCIGGGSYSPSQYAKELKITDIADYLKKQGM